MKTAFVFPGQGSQYAGMGKKLAEQFPLCRQVFETADRILGFPLSKICFEGPKEELDKTEITQPAILTTSLAIYELLKDRGIRPFAAAGLSLGEYSSLVASGALQFEDALKLVIRRGQIMQHAVPLGQGMMAAIIGLDSSIVEQVCAEASSVGTVQIANYNCPGQLVISGEQKAVQKAGDLLKKQGARVVPLAVSVPSHSSLMYQAAAAFKQELEKIRWAEPLFPVISNARAQEIRQQDLPDVLVEQLYKPVLWQQSITMMAEKVDCFIEVGPGKVLSGLIRKTVKNKLVGNVEDADSLERIVNKIKEGAS
ncbi:MAG TPA: ACP S-malonyltransferase [Syntrophaceticus sp.]|nr:ACP S-malonyltransferase [Syntrophaceticus sp.]